VKATFTKMGKNIYSGLLATYYTNFHKFFSWWAIEKWIV